MPGPEPSTYQEIVESLSGSLDLALSGYSTIEELDASNRMSHLNGDIDDEDFNSVREVEKQLADVWLKAAKALLLVVHMERLFEGDSRVAELEKRVGLLRSQLKNLH